MMMMMMMRITSKLRAASLCCASSRALYHSFRKVTRKAIKITLYDKLKFLKESSVVPILDQWVGEGRKLDELDLYMIIKQLRRSNRHDYCLQICQWMDNKSFIEKAHYSVPLRLDLISKVYGLKQAEEYFNTIPNASRVSHVYGALLCCYAEAKLVEKAEATMQKMRDLGYSESFSYKVMMGLYYATNKYEKIDPLMEEMLQKGIRISKLAYCIRLNAYVKASEIQEMDKLFLRMEADQEMKMDWHVYTTAANGYLKGGDREKALTCLKKSEYFIRSNQRKKAYEILITLYARVGLKDEVYRVWKLYKCLGWCYNRGYVSLMSAFAILDCIDEVEKIYQEWDARYKRFDFHVPNLMITVYCKKGLLEKAEALIKALIENRNEPNASTWSRLALGYVKIDDMEKAVEAIRKSILTSFPEWNVETNTVSACLDYLNSKGRLHEAEEIIKLLEEKGLLSEVVYRSLVKNLTKESVTAVNDEAISEVSGDLK